MLIVGCSPQNAENEVEAPIVKAVDSTQVIEEVEGESPMATIDQTPEVPAEKTEPDTLVILSGQLLGKDLPNRAYLVQDRLYKSDFKERINFRDSSFHAAIPMHEPGYYTLQIGRKKVQLYLIPGDSLYITYSPAFTRYVRIEGKGGARNNFLNSSRALLAHMDVVNKKAIRQSYKRFRELVDIERQGKENYLDLLATQLPEEEHAIVELEQKRVLYQWANRHIEYRKAHEVRNIAEAHYTDLVSNSKDDLMQLDTYKEFVLNQFDRKTGKTLTALKESGQIQDHEVDRIHEMMFNYIPEFTRSSKVRDLLRTKVVKNLIALDGTPRMNAVLMSYLTLTKDDDLTKNIRSFYHKKVAVDDATLAMDFTAVNSEGEELKLSELRGKYVYIDVWATWCVPCKMEQPHFDRLRAEYANQPNIEFLSISLDKNKAAWEKMIVEQAMEGKQLFIPGAWNSSFAKQYEIKGVPHFILIGPDGLILQHSATRPSKNIREDLASFGLVQS